MEQHSGQKQPKIIVYIEKTSNNSFSDKDGLLRLHTYAERIKKIWSAALKGYKFLIVNESERYYDLYAVEVSQKRLSTNFQNPLEIKVKVLGATSLLSFPFPEDREIAFLDSATYDKYWEEAVMHPEPAGALGGSPDSDIIYMDDDYSIYVASSLEDIHFIQQIAQLHAFGYKKSFLNLICLYKGERKGAICVNYSDFEASKELQKRKNFFRKDLKFVKNNSLMISRIHSEPRKFKIHMHLIKCVEQYAKGLVTQPEFSYIEGISYDYHPVSKLLNYNIIVPDRKEGVYYYFKRVFEHQQRKEKLEIGNIRKLLKERQELNFWILSGNRRLIIRSFEAMEWGLHDKTERNYNRGAWHIMKEGDVVFMCDKDTFELLGYLVVKSKRRKSREEEFGQYPLWMEFSEAVQNRNPFKISQKYFANYSGVANLERNKGRKWYHNIKSLGADGKDK
jgi:hypothetical protein